MELFQSQTLRNSQLGILGGKELIHSDLASIHLYSLTQENSLSKDMSKHVKGISTALKYPSNFYVVGSFLAGCVLTAGVTYFALESYPVISNIVMEGLVSGQDLPVPEEVIKDDIDLYLESIERHKR